MWNAPTTRPRATFAHRAVLVLESLEDREVPAIVIQVDYSYDTGFFTNNPDARAVIERAANELGNSISANLAAIAPSGSNTWSARFFNPATGAQTSVSNLTIPANTLRVFVGARTLSGTQAAVGGFGGYSVSGSQAWINTVQTRGWSGFATWGGSISFDTRVQWHFGQTTEGLTSSKLDFYSVAVHELGHVLGIGTANQWYANVSGGAFHGAQARSVYGGPVPLTADGAHWANNVTVNGQPVSLDPTIGFGQRVGWTALDAAALRDLGWGAVSPPPAPPQPPSPPPLARVPLARSQPVAFTGSTNGVVTMYTVANGTLVPTGQQLIPFVGYQGAIRVASGDFNGDGILDYAFTVGAGPQSVVQIMDGRDGSMLVGQTAIFPGFRGGLFVAAADIDRDGRAELVVSADAGAGPHIQTFRVVDGHLQLQSSFFAFDNPHYRGGARVAAGDLNRDGFADVVVTTGGWAEGRVAIYSGADLAGGVATRLYPDFHPFVGLMAGLNAAVGDMDGDGFGELAVVPDRGAPAHVKIWSGATLAGGGLPSRLPLVASFYAFPPTDGGGGRIVLRDLDGNGRAELVVASGNPTNGVARVFDFAQAVAGGGGAPSLLPLGNPNTFDGVYAGSQSGNHSADSAADPARLDDGPTNNHFTATADPVSHQCNCIGCRALTEWIAHDGQPDWFEAIVVA
ncbi:MAG: FG-GAP-like repeat-containing protein [Gemmataceae bacterium]|nr:FG-GAP-like repeat-containing protein [Gemmata sp.]MDW8198066.1 FG-GAP-like repeat-containing protein [Gemmataceae bacterium]